MLGPAERRIKVLPQVVVGDVLMISGGRKRFGPPMCPVLSMRGATAAARVLLVRPARLATCPPVAVSSRVDGRPAHCPRMWTSTGGIVEITEGTAGVWVCP